MHINLSDGSVANQPLLPETQPATLSALRIAAMRLSDTKRKPKLKTRDLVGLLLSHSARAWRCSMPRVHIKVSVRGLDGRPALRMESAAN